MWEEWYNIPVNLKDETESGNRRGKEVKVIKKENQSMMKRGELEFQGELKERMYQRERKNQDAHGRR